MTSHGNTVAVKRILTIIKLNCSTSITVTSVFSKKMQNELLFISSGHNNNNNNNIAVNVYGAVIIVRVHPVHLMNED